MIKKTSKGYSVVHCHGAKKGRPIKTYSGRDAKKKALALHWVIENKKKKKKGK